MSDLTTQHPQVADFYKNLHVMKGAVLDEDSYNRHMAAESATPDPVETPAASTDPFEAPQDFRQIAAQAFDSDRQEEYRPECPSFVIPVCNDDGSVEYIETSETYCPETMHILLGGTRIVRSGSGSYRTSSGSGRLSSGSYRITSGSFRTGSGSFRMGSGSFRLSSGSYRISSTSAHKGSGTYIARTSVNPPMPLCDPALLNQEAPYLGSLPWGMEAGGYGLNLI